MVIRLGNNAKNALFPFQIEVIPVPNPEPSVLCGGRKCLLLWGWPYRGISAD